MSRISLIFILLIIPAERVSISVRPRIFFQLLNLQFRLRQFGLADLGQPRAFFIPRQQRLQRQILGFHRFHDGFQLFQGFFEWDVAVFGRFIWAGRTSTWGKLR